jgi:F-type H+-transporting ATPase subunit delta
MDYSKVAKRYGKALFAWVQPKGTLDPVKTDVDEIRALIDGCDDFAAFLKSPLVPDDRRNQILSAILKDKVHADLYRFSEIMEAKDRLDVFAEALGVFSELYDEAQGILRVTIVSASKMDDGQLNSLKEKFSAKYSKTINAEVLLDDSLIGGFRVIIGDEVFDNSVSTQLNTLKYKLINA